MAIGRDLDDPRSDPLRVLRPDGATRYLQVDAVPMCDEAGAVEHVMVSYVDLTARKATEASLRESEEPFRSAFDQAAVPMALVVPDGRVLHVNQAFCRFLGYTEAEVLATPWKAFTHPDDAEPSMSGIRAVLEGPAQAGVAE